MPPPRHGTCYDTADIGRAMSFINLKLLDDAGYALSYMLATDTMNHSRDFYERSALGSTGLGSTISRPT